MGLKIFSDMIRIRKNCIVKFIFKGRFKCVFFKWLEFRVIWINMYYIYFVD